MGPRSTGKTTWLRAKLSDARWYDLLLESELIRRVRDPDLFRKEVEALPARSWVAVDEVQRHPALRELERWIALIKDERRQVQVGRQLDRLLSQ